MSRHPIWVFALVFTCAAPAGAASLECRERPRLGQADLGQADLRQADLGQAEQQQPAAKGQRPADRGHEQSRWMWWRVAETKTELGITDQQATDIDQIFQANMPALRAAKDELDKLDAEVAQVIKPAIADVTTVSQLVSRAEHARAKLTTTRTVMFYRMHRVLSPEQRTKLNAMFERWEAERRKTTDATRRR